MDEIKKLIEAQNDILRNLVPILKEIADKDKPVPDSDVIFNPDRLVLSKTNYKAATNPYKQSKGKTSHGNLFYYKDPSSTSKLYSVWDFGLGLPHDYPRIIPKYAGEHNICANAECILVATDRHAHCQKCNAVRAQKRRAIKRLVEEQLSNDHIEIEQDLGLPPPAKKQSLPQPEKEN